MSNRNYKDVRSAAAVVVARHVPADVKVHLRVPGCVKRAEVTETRDGDAVSIRLKGVLGHHVASCSRGKLLFYGPLLMGPAGYNGSGPTISEAERGNVPTGYIPDDMPRGLPAPQPGARCGRLAPPLCRTFAGPDVL